MRQYVGYRRSTSPILRLGSWAGSSIAIRLPEQLRQSGDIDRDAHLVDLTPHLQPVSIVLDLVHPSRPRRHSVRAALDEADLETIIRNFIAGEYDSALRVVAFNAAEGWSRDVSEDIAGEIIDRACDADETLTEGTKRFIDRHIDQERRPPAPSVRREPDQSARKKA
jgi:hypothetical protein